LRRATITISDDLEPVLEAYLRRQEVPPALTSILQAALREYLDRRGFTTKRKQFRITPAKRGSGLRDISLDHDGYLAGQ
jgi:hypothetical protein